jgi:hypothetical protein
MKARRLIRNPTKADREEFRVHEVLAEELYAEGLLGRNHDVGYHTLHERGIVVEEVL